MTNKERYKQAFNALHASGPISLEANDMKKRRRYIPKSAVAACTAAAVIIGSFGAAYAANVGGIQRTIQIWIHGEQTTAELTVSDQGRYSMTYENEDGETIEQGGGGIAIDSFGKERPLTEEEIMENMNTPDVSFEDDGRVLVSYMDQQLDITDKFDEEGFCYVELHAQGETTYLTVNHANGHFAWSKNHYIQPKEFK